MYQMSRVTKTAEMFQEHGLYKVTLHTSGAWSHKDTLSTSGA